MQKFYRFIVYALTLAIGLCLHVKAGTRTVCAYVVERTAAKTVGVPASVEWKLIERIHSFRVRVMLGVNMLNGRHPSIVGTRLLS